MVSDTKIQKADPAARRRAVIVVLVMLVLGASAIVAFENLMIDFESWAEHNIDYLLDHTYLIFLVFLIMLLPAFGAGVYLLVFANRVALTQRYPPPGCAVSRDTVVIEGARAVQRARLVQFISVLLLCAAASIPVIMWYILHTLAGAA